MELNKVVPSDNDDDSTRPPPYGTAFSESGRFPATGQPAGQPGVQEIPTGYGETAADAAAGGPGLTPGYAHYPPPNVMQAWMQPPPSYFPPAPGSAQPLNPYYPGMIMYGPPPPQYGMFSVSPGSQHHQHHQQQQQVVMYGGGDAGQQPVLIHGVDNYCGQILLSCFVFWCCNCLLGLIAFILAMVANSTAVSDPRSARQLGRASYSVSTVGIILTIIVIVVVICIFNSAARSCTYTYEDHCYNHMSTRYDMYDCPGRYSYHTGYCYYN